MIRFGAQKQTTIMKAFNEIHHINTITSNALHSRGREFANIMVLLSGAFSQTINRSHSAFEFCF